MDQLLATKLFIPQLGADLVRRQRLYERLEEGLKRKLTLVAAPAGFGKSTLVTGWLSETDHSVAWVSLDQGDNDPVRFWSYLIASIQTIHQEIGKEAGRIINAPGLRSTEPASISLINDISQHSADLIVVLDDYHVIETGQIHDSLSYLLDHQPPNLHIVVLTRVDPPLSIARLRAHSHLLEIRADDLQFSTVEATVLFNDRMGLSLNSSHIEALSTHTERWVVGLRLAALSLKGQSSYDAFIGEFTGGHQFILDYLTEEVLGTLSDAQRRFLLRTSILERFCGELCQAVTGDPSSQQMLDEIRKNNLFLIPLDTGGRWFRYHHLFAEVLSALMERDHFGEKGELHLKAAEWFESAGHTDEATEHALRSGNMDRARELILRHWLAVVHRGEVATALRWFDALPEDAIEGDPSVPLARCWVLFISGKSAALAPHLERATGTFKRLVDEKSLSEPEQRNFTVQLAMMHSVLARDRGEHAESVAQAEEAARIVRPEMPETIGTAWNMLAAAHAGAGDYDRAIEACERGSGPAYAEGNLTVAFGCTYGRAMYMLIQGRLNEADNLCRMAIDRAASDGHADYPAAGWLHIAMARIDLERYRLDEAEGHLSHGLTTALPGGFGEVVRSGSYIRAHLSAARGDLNAAAAVFQDTERIVIAMDDPYLTGELNREWAQLCLKAGDLDSARKRLRILDEVSTTTQHANLLLGRRWLFPRLLCAEDRYEETLSALDQSISSARTANSNGELIRLLALQAVALSALGDRMPALSALRQAVALGATGGYVWRWLDAGPRLGPLLRHLRYDLDTGVHPYVDSLLDACRASFGESDSPQPGDLLDPLTSRELEIMRLICDGYSNSEIAGELMISVNTIKKHTSNIYSKMGVSSRTQAIASARRMDLFLL